jgi:hypothetical protein
MSQLEKGGKKAISGGNISKFFQQFEAVGTVNEAAKDTKIEWNN